MVSPEKMQELRAVVNFWKFRVDDTKSQLHQLLARQTNHCENDRCGQSIMTTLVEMKTREVSDSQRGLRRAQANLGQAMELAVIAKRGATASEPITLSPGAPMNTPARMELNGHRRTA